MPKPPLRVRRMSGDARPPIFSATLKYTERYPDLDSRCRHCDPYSEDTRLGPHDLPSPAGITGGAMHLQDAADTSGGEGGEMSVEDLPRAWRNSTRMTPRIIGTLATSLLRASVLAAPLLPLGCGRGDPQPLLLATTTSVEDSGLLSHLLDAYRRETPDAAVRYLAVGSGEALELGRRDDADLLLVHHPSEEVAFVAEGYGEARVPIMVNDFLLVGPAADPANVAASRTAAEAMLRIERSGELFLSRGDNSGTHHREMDLWRAADIEPSGEWYQEAGQGMGPVLQMGSERGAYVLTDRSTFYAMESRLDLAVLFEGDPQLRNVYSVIIVRGSRRDSAARALQDWLTSPTGRRSINEYRDDYGRPLFRALTPEDAAAEKRLNPDSSLQTEDVTRASGSPGSPSSGTGSSQGYRRPLTSPETPESRLRPTLRDRLLCRSVPPAHAGGRCS